MLIEKIDQYLLSRETKKREHHYPSDAEKCILQLWNNWHDVEITDKMTAGEILKCEMGNATHDKISALLHEIFPDHLAEIPFRVDIGLKHELSGRLDNLFSIDGKIYGVEVKSKYGRAVAEIQRTQQPTIDALSQIALYQKYTGVTDFILLYIGRDNGYRTEFINNKLDEELITELIERYKIAEGEVKPEKEYNACIVEGEFKDKFQANKVEYKGDWQCLYCKYKTGCWKNTLTQKGKFIGGNKIV